ncbi:MAG: hypothetical protein KDM63_09890, partial [Verrucomicrobiae bacterium]|nr:hypothetical protein [Verrucomicrobiae bacterium]
MNLSYEISDRFIEAHDASGLLYSPLSQPLTYRQTRRYEFEVEGDASAVESFVRHTLLDKVSQDLHSGEEPAYEGFRFLLDYGMKPGALDLEKEMVVKYHRGLSNPGFELKKLTIRQRIYVFGEG